MVWKDLTAYKVNGRNMNKLKIVGVRESLVGRIFVTNFADIQLITHL